MNNVWVAEAVKGMRRSSYYRKHIIDEWYETLPIPQWSRRNILVSVLFGKNVTDESTNIIAPSRVPCWPHIVCSILYPASILSWSEISSPSGIMIDRDRDNHRFSLNPNIMESRRNYYVALSEMLSSHSWLDDESVKFDCKWAMKTYESMLGAANLPLAPLYDSESIQLVSWIHENCSSSVK